MGVPLGISAVRFFLCKAVAASLRVQEISNTLAKLSVYACARLGGYLLAEDDTTPDNPAVKKSLSALLTPYLAKKLSENSPHEVTWPIISVICSLSFLSLAVHFNSHFSR